MKTIHEKSDKINFPKLNYEFLFNLRPCYVRLDIREYENALLKLFNIKPCFVRLSPFKTEMSEPVAKRRPGRPPKSANNTPKAKPAPATPATPASDKSGAKKATKRNALDDSVIISGGRSKRTPKPNPKYMDEAVFSSTKALKEDSADSEAAEEDAEDVLSDEYRAPSIMPLKKRSLNQKSFGIKRSPISGGPGRKPGSTIKRKLGDADIDIDDDRGKQLFLDAKRRLTHVSLSIFRLNSSLKLIQLIPKKGFHFQWKRNILIFQMSNSKTLH